MAMRPRDWFAVGVRLLGVWAFVRAFEYVVALGAIRLSIVPPSQIGPFDAPSQLFYYLCYATADLALAAFLILGAEQITRLVFREPKPVEPDHRDEAV